MTGVRQDGNGHGLTVAVRIDAALFRRFAAYDAFRVKRRWKSPAVFALILLVSAALCYSRYQVNSQAVLLGTVLLSVGLGLPSVYFASFFVSVSGQVKKLGLDRAKPVYTVALSEEPDGIRVRAESGETAAYRWDGVFAVYRDRDCTYLYVAQSRAFLLPDRDVGEGAEALSRLLERCLQSSKSESGQHNA